MITLARYVSETNRTRYYNLSIQYDLLAGVTLVREWGSVGRAGRVITTAYPNEQAALPTILDVLEAKKKRGYEIKEIPAHLDRMLSNFKASRDKKICQLRIICIHLAATLQNLKDAKKRKPRKLKEISTSFNENESSPNHERFRPCPLP